MQKMRTHLICLTVLFKRGILSKRFKPWRARVAELADAADLKSSGHLDRAGSSPATSTKLYFIPRSRAAGSLSGS